MKKISRKKPTSRSTAKKSSKKTRPTHKIKRASAPRAKRTSKVAKRVAKTPAKTSGTTLTITLDNTERRAWLPKQPDMLLTESDFVAKACALGNMSPEILLREAIVAKARSLISTALSPASAAAKHGIIGSADARLEIALARCQEKGVPITATRVGDAAEPPVTFRTAKRFLQRKGLLKI